MNAQRTIPNRPSRRRAARLLAACLLAAPLGLAAFAQAESLTDAWRMAFAGDASLAAAHSERIAAEADRSAATRQRWPALDIGGAYTQLKTAPAFDIATPNGQFQSPKIWQHDAYGTASADLSVPIWTSGRISGSIGAAAAGARGAAAVETISAADLKLAVAEAYVGVFRARSALRVAESSAASLQAHAEDVRLMYDKQAVTKADLLAAQVALANAEQQRLRAANALSIANATYNRWVGQPLDRTPELADPQPERAALDGAPLEQLIAYAALHRPELAALAAREDSLHQAARQERAQSLPQVALHAGYNHFDNQILDRENFASVGVTFQWRLFDSGQVHERTAALDNHARAAGQALADQRSVIALQVQTGVLNREDAAARVRAAAIAVEQAQENVRTAKELYDSGLATNTQVLEAEALRATALTDRDAAAYDLIVAGYRLSRAIGDL